MDKRQQNNHNCGHDHSNTASDHPHVHPVVKNLKTAFFLNITFTVIEIIGGIYTNSVAILSDAMHDLGDSIAIGSSLWMEKFAEKGRSSTFSYGYKRFSPLAALFSSLILFIGSAFIIYHAVPRLFNPEAVHAKGMLWMAVLGVVFNGIAVLRLKSSGNSVNQKAVMLHLLEDVLGWIAVLAGSIIISFTEWNWIDPLLSLLIALVILYNAVKNLKVVLKLFLQSVPAGVEPDKIINQLSELTEIKEVHDFHSWSLDGNFNVASVHLVMNDSSSVEVQKVVRENALRILETNSIHHATVQIEFENERCGLEKC